MGSFSLWHWLVVIMLVLLLFGRGRISGMMGDIGKGLKSFKQALADDEDDKDRQYSEHRRHEGPPQVANGQDLPQHEGPMSRPAGPWGDHHNADRP